MPYTKKINISVTINAPVSKVWQALTDPAIIKEWLWDTEINVVSDWKVGSSILFKGKFHDMDFISKGHISKLEKEKVFQYTYWSPLSETADLPSNYHTIDFNLKDEDNTTVLTLTIKDLINEVIYGHMNFYWITTLNTLKKSIEK